MSRPNKNESVEDRIIKNVRIFGQKPYILMDKALSEIYAAVDDAYLRGYRKGFEDSSKGREAIL